MRRTVVLCLPALLICAFVDPAFAATSFSVVPFEFDPGNTNLVAAKWKTGLGCPTGGGIPASPTNNSTPPFSDPGCPTGDSGDQHNDGLLLSKVGPTSTNASAGATILGVKGITLTEIGYDLRKPEFYGDDKGSHCAGSPRLKVVTQDGTTHSIGCASPATTQTTNGDWIRLRFALASATPPISSTFPVKSIQVVLEEGSDTGPDYFGLAVLDNIDINGTLIGRGPTRTEETGGDAGHGGNGGQDFTFTNSATRPETSSASYQDYSQGMKLQTISGARSISYTGTCVTFVADALLNDDPGYVLTFAACDLSALSTPLVPQIGNYSVVLTGVQGVVYQKSGPMNYGSVSIHPY
jgi:hypothetical protein